MLNLIQRPIGTTCRETFYPVLSRKYLGRLFHARSTSIYSATLLPKDLYVRGTRGPLSLGLGQQFRGVYNFHVSVGDQVKV